MILRAATGPLDELAGTIVDLRSRVQTLEVIAHRHLLDLDPSGWIVPAFLNAWVNLGAPWQTLEYRIAGDVVTVRGVVTGGAIGLAVFTLLPAFCPPADIVVPVSSNGAFGSVTITAAGNVTPTAGNAASVSLCFSFSVA